VPLQSMTGFGRHSDTSGVFSWAWELKSVNGKSLDVKYRIPSLLSGFDQKAKKLISSNIGRGSVFVSLDLKQDKGADELIVHRDRLKTLAKVAGEMGYLPGLAPARVDGLLNCPGIVEITAQRIDDGARADLEERLLASLKMALDALVAARTSEGARMAAVLDDEMDHIADLVAGAANCAGARLEAIKERLKNNIDSLLDGETGVSEDRLAQEVAILAVKADIREEIDRLEAHIEDAKTLLKSDKLVGRRLDFLCQEFNREANTLCSKSQDKDLTRIGLDLKTTIDQFREQIQNIE